MVVQYPYSLSLRYLLAMKSQQADNVDLERNIELLVTYGIDRTHLYKIFSQNPIVLEDLEESVVMGEDFLELKELSVLERIIDDASFIKDNNDIAFLEEKLSKNGESKNGIDHTGDIPIPPTILESEKIEEAESISNPLSEADSHEIEENTTLENPSNDAEELSEAPFNEKSETIENQPVEEEFVIMDFETNNFEIEDKSKSTGEIAPSESVLNNEIEYDKNGLPMDAIEVNDFDATTINIEDDDGSIIDLFLESEQEAVAEEAVSDSQIFINNPEEVLDIESKKALASSIRDNELVEGENQEIIAEDIIEITEENNIEKEPIIPEKGDIEAINITKVAIPFEVNFSDTDPSKEVLIEESNLELIKETVIEETVSEEIIRETSVVVNKEEEIELETSPEPIEVPTAELKNAQFQFDSLAQLEKDLATEKFSPSNQPIPKIGFTSWQEQYSGVSTFSSLNLMPLNNTTGKVIKKKKKVARKKFEKTVAYAEESLKEDENIASETLAQLLTEQGHPKKAIAMYEELCLLLPEKSAYFAAEIEKIQNLPKKDS